MLINVTKGYIIASNIEKAINYWKRMKGLLGRISIPDDYALVIYKCTGIHTYKMQFDIDVIFLDKDRKVIEIIRHMTPGNKTDIDSKREYAIEMKAGLAPAGLQNGEELYWC